MNAEVAERAMMTPDEAVREVLRIERRAESLAQRTGGLTWMIWGVINLGIFLTYEAIAFANPPNPWANVELALAWAPWVVMGTGATTVLWRSIAVVMPSSVQNSSMSAVWAIVIFLVLAVGGSLAIVAANAPINPFEWATLAVGVSAAAAGGSGLVASSKSERAFWLLGGLCVVALTIVLDLGSGRLGFDSGELLLVAGPGATTALLFGGGLWTAAS
jgi:hypothetical protein